MKRIIRNRRLTPEEAATYRDVRKQIEAELPDLIARHHARTFALKNVEGLLAELKAMREAQGLSLTDVMERTGMDRSAISRLESGQRPNPTIDTLIRYAEALGTHVQVTLAPPAEAGL